MASVAPSVAPFRNEPIRSFSSPAERAGMTEVLAAVRATFGTTYPLVINGERIAGPGTIPSINPAHPAEVVGDVVAGSRADVDDALEAATAAFASWSRTPVAARADLLFRAAAAIRERKDW